MIEIILALLLPATLQRSRPLLIRRKIETFRPPPDKYAWWVGANPLNGNHCLKALRALDERPKTHRHNGLLDTTLQAVRNAA